MVVWFNTKTTKISLTQHFINRTLDLMLCGLWNFIAASHGKSPCDGLGGSIKRKMTTVNIVSIFANIQCFKSIVLCGQSVI